MRFYFAYGSNMIAADMHRRCPSACFEGLAALPHHRFCITRSGYASLRWERGATAHGVLWSISPRDEQRLDAYEEVAEDLYNRDHRGVETAEGRHVVALVYFARDHRPGRPRRGYVEAIVDAAREQGLPAAALADIAAWLPASVPGADR
jgi:AIG2-like family